MRILKTHGGLSTTALFKKISETESNKTPCAIFLDRDGVINLNKEGYIHRIEDFEFVPGAIKGLKLLSDTDYKLIIISNQSGIARGYYKRSDVEKLHAWMLQQLKENGVHIDSIYYCPHGPEDGCHCRKPKIGMFQRAAKRFGLSLVKSWFVDDDERCVIMGRIANVKTIKIGKRMALGATVEPNFYAKDLLHAARIITHTLN
jgi:D-glycero-D-manno-heptose 1,7-bisphosphate phosphatase